MKRHQAALFVVLGLMTFAIFGISTPPASAQGDEWAETDRGRSFIEYQLGNEFKQEIYGGPIFTQADNGDWVSYVFEDLGDRYQIQHPYASIKFFDYYSTIWDENLQNVAIYDDRWTVEYLNRQGRWTDSSFWNIVRSYEIGDDWISIFRTGDTVIGQRVENYTFRRGSPVKIKVEQICDDAETVRFVWKPSGIVATSENLREGHLTYWDENNWIGTLAWFDELEIVDNIDVTVDTHAQGRKATITFGSFEVGAGGAAILDPTETFYSGTTDGYIYLSRTSYSNAHDASSGIRTISPNYILIGQNLSGGWYTVYRGFVFFDTSNLPNAATIVDATLSLRYYADYSTDNEFALVVQNGQPDYPHEPLQTTDYNNINYFDNGGSFHTTTFSSGYNDIALDENARENWIRKDNTTKFCLRSSIDIDNIAPTGSERIAVYSSNKGSGYQPKLIITWTTLLPQPYNLKVEDLDSPQQLTTLTPEFSFTYYSENGDNMENFRVQVGTSAADNSLWDITTAQENENNDNITITYAGIALSRGTQYFWRVRVQDNNSTWGNFSDNENFQINQLPTVSITTPDGYDVEVGEGIGFASSASDPDSDGLTYSWDFGDLAGTSTQQNPSYSYSSAGDYTVTLYVNDGYEDSATDSIIVSVGGGAPPPPPPPDEDGDGNGDGAPSNGGGGAGGGGGFTNVIEQITEAVEETVQPTKNILFQPIFMGIPLWVPMIGAAGGARAAKKKGKGIFWSIVLVFVFLLFFGMNVG